MQVFGEKIGVAFQIQDDLLNLIETDESKNVKDFRNDITEGKRTLIVCKTLELADATERNELIEILQSKTSDEDKLERAVDRIYNWYIGLDFEKLQIGCQEYCGYIEEYHKEFERKMIRALDLL